MWEDVQNRPFSNMSSTCIKARGLPFLFFNKLSGCKLRPRLLAQIFRPRHAPQPLPPYQHLSAFGCRVYNMTIAKFA